MLGQAGAGLPAAPAQGAGAFHIGFAGRLLGGGERFQMLVEMLQGVRFLSQLAVVLNQFLGAQAVFARQRVGLVEPFFHLAETLRVQIQLFQIMAQVVGGGLHLQASGLHRVENRGQGVVAAARLLHPVADLAELVVAGAFVAVVKRGDRLLAEPYQRFRVAQALLLLFQFRQLPFAERQGVQLLELKAQQFLPFGLLAGAGQCLVVSAAGLLPGAPVVAHLLRLGAGLGEVVQQLAVGFLAQQRLVLMLAVDADQHLAELAHFRERRGGAVDVGPRAAVRAHRAAQQALVAVVQFALAQPGPGRRVVGHIEGGEHFRAVAAGAHHGAVGPFTQGQRQSVDDHRLAGAGLAADHGKAGLGLQLELVDGGEVANTEVREHGLSFWPVVSRY